jgi:hypothetical protein
MRASCEVVVERQPLLAAVTAKGPARRLMDPDLLVIAPAAPGISVWTAVLDADLEAEGTWSYKVLVSRERVAALLGRSSGATVKLTYAGTYLQIDKTLITIIDASPWGSFQSRRGRHPQPTLQTSLFPVTVANGPLKPKRRQLATRGLPLFPG